MKRPKTCEQYRAEMLATGVAVLEAARREELRELLGHLEQCSECRRAAGEYEGVREALGAGEGGATAEPAGGWAAFEERMQRALAGQGGRETAGRVGPWGRWRHWRAAAAVVLAAGLGVGAGMVLRRPGGTPGGFNGHVDAAMVRLTAPELRQNAEAFDNISDVFDRRASWFMLADGGRQSDVGIAPEPVDGNVAPLVIRMVVRRAGGMNDTAARWGVVAQCDLVIVPGQTAEVTVASLDKRRLNFHVQTDASNLHRVTMMLELGDFGSAPAGEGGGGAAAGGMTGRDQPRGMLATTLVLDFGHSATVGQIATSGGVYSLAVGLDALPDASAQRENKL